MIDVVLVDDEALVRTGLAALLEAEQDLRVVGETHDGSRALDLVRRTRPDIVVMDVRMPHVDGIQATRTLLNSIEKPPKVIVLTTFENDDYVYGALRVGACGFLLKRTRPEEIVTAIRVVHAGDALLFPAAIRALAARQPTVDTRAARAVATLTERETNTLAMMARGLSNAEIAAEAFIGVETVKTHVSNVLNKLGARDRTQAVIAAYDAGVVRPRP